MLLGGLAELLEDADRALEFLAELGLLLVAPGLRQRGHARVQRAGLLLQAIKSGYQCEAVGIEPGQAYREASQKAGLQVYSHLEDLFHDDESCFDLISLIHVLEHLPDPVATLTQLRKEWLSQGGWLLLEVPNLYCHDSFEVAHLVSFSQHTLTQTLHRAGFRVLVASKHGQPRSRLLPLYITVLAQPVAESELAAGAAVIPERGVRLKRSLGLAGRRVVERLLPKLAWLP